MSEYGRGGILLVGPPGSGKTTVGAALARRLGFSFYDGDELVEKETGTSIHEIIVTNGPDAVYKTQVAALAQHFRYVDSRYVLAVPSGAVDIIGDIEQLRDKFVVFLDADLATCFPRTGLNASRPAGLVAPRALFREMLKTRHAAYLGVSDLVVEVGGKSVDEIVSRIVSNSPDSMRGLPLD